jgi:hypothetical protein
MPSCIYVNRAGSAFIRLEYRSIKLDRIRTEERKSGAIVRSGLGLQHVSDMRGHMLVGKLSTDYRLGQDGIRRGETSGDGQGGEKLDLGEDCPDE